MAMYFNGRATAHSECQWRKHEALALMLEWAASHRQELRANWDKARRGEPLDRIEPLE